MHYNQFSHVGKSWKIWKSWKQRPQCLQHCVLYEFDSNVIRAMQIILAARAVTSTYALRSTDVPSTSQERTRSKTEQSLRAICHAKEMPRKVWVLYLWDAFNKEKVDWLLKLKKTPFQGNCLFNKYMFPVFLVNFWAFFCFPSISF